MHSTPRAQGDPSIAFNIWIVSKAVHSDDLMAINVSEQPTETRTLMAKALNGMVVCAATEQIAIRVYNVIKSFTQESRWNKE